MARVPVAGLGSCPSTWPTSKIYKKSGGGGCACDCAPTGGSCAGTVDTRSGAACTGAATNLAVSSAACTDLSAALPLPVAVSPKLSGTPPTSCGASARPNLGAPNTTETCTGVTGTTDAKCETGEICVPKAGGFSGLVQTCLVHDGEVACPSKLSSRTVIATDVQDGRSCGTTCACGTTSCSTGATLEAFSSPGCSGSVRKVNADGSCTTSGAAPTGVSYRYTAGTGCSVTTPAAVLGSVTYTAPRTLCCSFGF